MKQKPMKYGDIICVKKPLGYFHYGVYLEDECIIHYAPEGDFERITDAMKNAFIHETDMQTFRGKSGQLFVCNFYKFYFLPNLKKVNIKSFAGGMWKSPLNSIVPYVMIINTFFNFLNYKLYSPEETVQRARSKLEEKNYNLVNNNCEHFAIWCKTGINESHQVNIVMTLLRLIPGFLLRRSI